MAQLIDGFNIAQKIRGNLALEVAKIKEKTGYTARLDVILVGSDPASATYVRNKEKAALEVGITATTHVFHENVTEKELVALIVSLNKNKKVSGILVQLPLPKHLNAEKILETIDPEKDVDGLHPHNIGKLVSGGKGILPCTPKGCLHLIKSVQQDISGLNAVVIGRSNIVGKPMGLMLLNENATVTIVHSKTKNLPEICKKADILVAAIGRPKFVTQDFIKDNAIVIDVGINRMADGKLCGDVDFNAVFDLCRAITPVPKGVGPMTIAMLLSNTVDSFTKSLK